VTSTRPYLLRALNEWILDNGMTPHIVVDATIPGTHVPPEHVRDGRITLNLSPSAVRELVIGNEAISFGARFGGRHFDVVVPPGAVLAIFARESGAGMSFPPEPPAAPAAGDDAPATTAGKKVERPHLRIVKSDGD